jgi:nucleotide-binding universal stress UspA family protein
MSVPYRHVGCAIDDSEISRAALCEACRVWEGGARRLSVVHVADPPPYAYATPMTSSIGSFWLDGARAWLRAQVAPLEGAVPVLLSSTPAAQAVCEWAEGACVDLLVAGAYRGPVERALKGSFARYLAYHASCPVLLVGPRAGPVADEAGPRGRPVRTAAAAAGVVA